MGYSREEPDIYSAEIKNKKYQDIFQSRLELLMMDVRDKSGGGGGSTVDITSIPIEELEEMWGDHVPTDPASGMSPVSGDEIDDMWDGTYDDGDGADPGTLTPDDISHMWGD